MKDILLIVAYFKVFGCDIYGSKHLGLDTGKNNLVSYFCDKRGWSEWRLKQVVKLLRDEYVLDKVQAEAGMTCLKLSILHKRQIKYIELNLVH